MSMKLQGGEDRRFASDQSAEQPERGRVTERHAQHRSGRAGRNP